MRHRYRRNADPRLQRARRRYRELPGDPGALADLVTQLRRLDDNKGASALVRDAMVNSREWAEWPDWDVLTQVVLSGDNYALASIANEQNFDMASSVDEPVAAPGLIVEVGDEHGDVESHYFTDGPYVMNINHRDMDLVHREMNLGDMPAGERSFIPIWRVRELLPPPYGIDQRAHHFLASLGVVIRDGVVFLDHTTAPEGVDVFTDGPVIDEQEDRTWKVWGEEFLTTSVAPTMLGFE